jgi:hypothetical protein
MLMSVQLASCMFQLENPWMDFDKIWYVYYATEDKFKFLIYSNW